MKKMMKKVFTSIIAFALAEMAMAQVNDPKVWGWDFPMYMDINVEAGQQALSCQMHYFQNVKEGDGVVKKTMIWYDTEIATPGKEKTVVNEYGNKIEVPNTLIIPLAKSAKAKKGDLLLTHSKYHEMQRAIVIDASTPTEPVVCFLDDASSWPGKPDSPKLAEKLQGEKLKPGSFNVLKDGRLESGAQVAYKKDGDWKFGKVIHVSGDKVLLSVFASRIDCVSKDQCVIVPFKEKIKKGDKVWVMSTDEYKSGYTVVGVDIDHGHIWTQADGSQYSYCHGLGEVTKVLK